MDALAHLLRSPPAHEPIPSLEAWLERLAACPFEKSIDRALWAGFEADRLGYAFVGGYHAALRQLVIGAAEALGQSFERSRRLPVRLSLAATESRGAHPRTIATKLEEITAGQLRLHGEKTFATLASVADELLVVASRGTGPDGKNHLQLVRVRTNTPGITIEDRPPTPFAPEIPHARVKLADVAVREDDVLPGDGYSVYLKPFRTIEDTHVLAATLGHLIRTARSNGFATAVSEGCFASSIALRQVAVMDASDPAAHIALAGLFDGARRLLSQHECEWDKADVETRDRWRRDVGLLVVAETARQKRTETAWRTLAHSS